MLSVNVFVAVQHGDGRGHGSLPTFEVLWDSRHDPAKHFHAPTRRFISSGARATATRFM